MLTKKNLWPSTFGKVYSGLVSLSVFTMFLHLLGETQYPYGNRYVKLLNKCF